MGTLTATPSDFPPYVTLAIAMTGATITRVKVERLDPDGFWRTIVGGDSVPLVAGQGTTQDHEGPLDKAVQYRASQLVPVGSEVVTSAWVTVNSNGRTYLKDMSNPTLIVEIPVVTSIATLTRNARAGVFSVIDRANPIVVSTRRQGPTGEMIAHTLTDAEREQVVDILTRGVVLLLQTPPPYGFGAQYVSIGDVAEARVGLAYEQSRRWTMPFVVVDRPEGLSAPSTIVKTWQAVKDTYPTWGDLKASGKTWRQLLEDGP